ncbi:MAG: hypothetical protein IH885_06015 [Myxococcales bacterium]|nr:hypothetical protein [Myxococcales bacterium]
MTPAGTQPKDSGPPIQDEPPIASEPPIQSEKPAQTEPPADCDKNLKQHDGTPGQQTLSDEDLVLNEGILDEAILDEEMLAEEAPHDATLDAATEALAAETPQPVEAAEPTIESVQSESALRPIEMDDLITDEIEVPPSLMEGDLLPESDDLLELEGLEDVKLSPAAIEPAPGGKITAIDEDLTKTTPTIDSSEDAEIEGDLFERPGVDLSELSDDETKD